MRMSPLNSNSELLMNDDGDDDDNKVDNASIDFLFLFRKQDEEEEDPAALVGSFKRCKKEIQHFSSIIFANS